MQLKQQQRGMTFVGLIFTAIVIVMLGMVVIQAIPTYLEYRAVQTVVQRAAEGTTVAEVRSLFDKGANLNQITSISGKDLEVGKQNGKVVVSFAYAREIHLFGPAYLVMKYEGESK